ncbi:molybdopterin-dependent oxidoreductase [Altererythrobacter xixiisoli]|uniref:Molybdopterin-dependent oxidoreductase n=1 Tax=Croceibacterium xixiisoli TaxID=1476466 RepID=A0A6I4TYD9_9SPHN|nr:molybdopterin cofactor-binding domain-containing protein [Croceibacterium xixiisoli]MXP00291.1 molybdopterin-dependent oxidoreductase [Croceibacterium xixiisoli]
MHLTRRGMLAGAAAGGGLTLAWWLLPRNFPSPLQAFGGEVVFGAWLKIGSDGIITVAVPQLEMGQGITTLLPQIVAMELGADWRQIAVEPAVLSGAYANYPLAARWAELWRPVFPQLADQADERMLRRWAEAHHFSATADGMSLPAYEQPCREAAAAARAMLAMAAAERWGVRWEECEARAGFILHGDKQASFADLAADAADFSPPDPAPLLPAAPVDRGVVQEVGDLRELPYPRLDLPSKVDGTHLFAADVRLPDMVFAAIRHGPVGAAELSSHDMDNLRGHRAGVVGVVKGKRWLAVAATSWWVAERALERLAPRFRLTAAPPTNGEIEQQLDDAIRSSMGQRIAERGEGDRLMGKPDLALRYDVAPAAHGTIETGSCTARLANGRLELWAASQAPEQARAAAAAALGLGQDSVVLYPVAAGGSFDRRLEQDHLVQAALIAREIGRPVQLMWSRWQEQLALRPRPPVAAVLSARIGAEGQIDSFRARLAMPAAALEFGHRLFDGKTPLAAIDAAAGRGDTLAVEGMMPPYAIPNVAVDHVPVTIGLPSGRLRGNAHGYTCFMRESFIDEIAQRNGQEPLSYRIAMLGQDLRLAECLQRAARLGEWGGGGAGTGQGLACHAMADAAGNPQGGGRIALVANAGTGAGGVRVNILSAAVDIGRIINRDIALQQIEGGLLFGLGLALGSGVDYRRGLPAESTLAALNLPTLADCPEIRVELIESDADPFDPGEIAVAPVAAAIANALHAATGLRLRRLPLLSGGL